MDANSMAILVLLGSFFLMVFLRFPIAYAVALSSVFCLLYQGHNLTTICQQMVKGISSFSLPELTLPHFDGSGWNFPQAALAGGGTTRTTNLGGGYITVHGYNARNDEELAQTVADKINGMIHEDDSVFK